MDAEKRTQIAITMTREILASMFDDPGAILDMVVNDVNPEEIEEKVSEILEYLEKTDAEAEDS